MPGQKATEATRREQILKAAHEVALRRGIDGLTVRAVAARARLSHSLVLFHFKRKDQLGLALLDRVLATTVSPAVPQAAGAVADPRERLLALLRQELRRLSAEPWRVRLLLEYWARGAHNAVIRKKIMAGLDEYRAVFRGLAEPALRAHAKASGEATADGIAAAAVSLILGFPVQAMIAPDEMDAGEYLATLEGLVGAAA
jgi:TetR/AcrR family transcriptional regulator, transcriptional repressor of bet genes